MSNLRCRACTRRFVGMGVSGKVNAPSILVHDSSFPRPAASFMTSSQESTVAQKNTALQVVFLLGVLGMFFASLELMEDSFKLMGGGVAEYLLKMASNPFVGLFIGILATSLVQSSSTTTTRTGIPCRGRQGGAGASCRITVSA